MRYRRLVAVPAVLVLTAFPSGCTSASSGSADAAASRAAGAASGTSGAAAGASRAAAACTVAAAGDIAGDDWRRGAARSARLIRAHRPSRVVALGDLAYDNGSTTNFTRYYRPTWGAFKRRTIAVPGNHEYQTSRAVGLARYFGAAARRDRAVPLCNGWRLVVLNTYSRGRHIDPVAVRRAAAFLAADVRRHPRAKRIAAWHVPRFSSGGEHGNDRSVAAIWNAAVRGRVRIVLNAHDHDYERFAPVGRGHTVQFVNGLGGHHIRPFGKRARASLVRFTGTPAVLFLTLRPGGFSWAERAVTGRLVDRGSR